MLSQLYFFFSWTECWTWTPKIPWIILLIRPADGVKDEVSIKIQESLHPNTRHSKLEASLFPWLWSSGNFGKHNFFIYCSKIILTQETFWRGRTNFVLEDYSGVLCNSGREEASFHLFFECPFSTSCWISLSIH